MNCNMLIIRNILSFEIGIKKEIKSILKERNERDKALNIENHD